MNRKDRSGTESGEGVRLPDWASWMKDAQGKLAPSGNDYELHMAAHEWSLASGLEINEEKDFKSIPSLKVRPFEHQVDNAILFFRRLSPRGMILDDVGLGKTITAGLIATELLSRGRVESILVVCPKALIEQWQAELEQKFGIRTMTATGKGFDRLERSPFWVVSYKTAQGQMDAILERRFDLVLLDEAHALKSLRGAQKPSLRAKAFERLMNGDVVRYCVMLTATPIQDRIWDLFSLIEILRAPQPNPLGTAESFREQFVADSAGRVLNSWMREEFRSRVSEVAIRKRRVDTRLHFPGREVKDMYLTPLPEEAAYIRAGLSAMLERPGVVQATHARSLMSSPWAFAASMEKTASHWETPQEERRALQELAARGRRIERSAKVDAVVNLVRTVLGSGAPRMIIFTQRLETLRHLATVLEKEGLGSRVGVYGGNDEARNHIALRDYQSEPPERPILLASDKGAQGLNLQAGNLVVNYDLPWNPMLIEQRIGRVQRLGQKAANVVVCNLILKGTIEDAIVRRLLEKLRLFEVAIGDMDVLLEGSGLLDKEGSLETILKRLILKAAAGKDVEEEIRLEEESHKAAEERLREMKRATEEALGAIHPGGGTSRLEALSRLRPRLPLRDVVVEGLRRAGAVVRIAPDGRAFLSSRGRSWERPVETELQFPDSGGEGGTGTMVAPGTPIFERAVGPLKSGARLLLFDRSKDPIDRLREAITERLGKRGIVVEAVKELSREEKVAARAALLVRSTVFSDRFETVLEVNVGPTQDGLRELLGGSLRGTNGAKPETKIPAPIRDSIVGILAGVGSTLASHVGKDESSRRFRAFYRSRYDEEVLRLEAFLRSRAGTHAARGEETLARTAEREPGIARALDSLRARFLAETEAEPIGVWAERYARVRLELRVRGEAQRVPVTIEVIGIPSHIRIVRGLSEAGVDESELRLLGCSGGHLTPEGAGIRVCSEEKCGIACCDRCLESGTKDLKVAVCAECSGVTCDEHGSPCDGCGKRLCRKHERARTTRGKRACRDCRQLLKSGEVCLSEEALQSSATGDWYRHEDLHFSAVSGVPVEPKFLKLCSEGSGLLLECEGETCDVSGRFAKKELLEFDSSTGKRVLRRLLARSNVSGVFARPEAMVRSGLSGRKGLATEGGACSACGLLVLSDESLVCPESKRTACKSHFRTSEATGAMVLPDYLDRCDVTGRLVETRLLRKCPESGKRAEVRLFVLCEETHHSVLPEGRAVCSGTGLSVRRSLLRMSDVSGRAGLARVMLRCSKDGRSLLPDEAVVSSLSGIPLCQDHTENCPICSWRMDRSETRQCRICETRYCCPGGGGSECPSCLRLVVKRMGDEVSEDALVILRGTRSWAKKARIVVSRTLGHVLFSPGFWAFRSRRELVVFHRGRAPALWKELSARRLEDK